MKKLILLIVLVSTGFFVNAQNTAAKPKEKPDANTRATRLTETMNTQLGLTANQKTKAFAINLERAKGMDANHAKNAENKDELAKGKNVILTKWDKDIRAILTADQLPKWNKYIEEQKVNHSEVKE